MQKYNGQLIRQFASNVTGNAASGVTVTVRRQSDAGLATLYVDNNIAGATLLNPITTGAGGHFSFYAADGVYMLTFSDSTPAQIIQLQDVSELQAQFDAAVLNAGYIPSGTFSAGATLTQANQVLSDGSSYWRWDGSFPKVVTAGSAPTPLGVGGWVLVSDFAFRNELAAVGSGALVGGIEAGDIANALRNTVTPENFGTGPTAIQQAINYCSSLGGGTVLLGPKTYTVTAPIELKRKVNLIGVDIEATVIHKPSANKVDDIDAVLIGRAAEQVNNFRLENFKVLGNRTSRAAGNIVTTNGIWLNFAHFYKISNVMVENCLTGFHLNQNFVAQLDRITGLMCQEYGFECVNSCTTLSVSNALAWGCRGGYRIHATIYSTFRDCACDHADAGGTPTDPFLPQGSGGNHLDPAHIWDIVSSRVTITGAGCENSYSQWLYAEGAFIDFVNPYVFNMKGYSNTYRAIETRGIGKSKVNITNPKFDIALDGAPSAIRRMYFVENARVQSISMDTVQAGAASFGDFAFPTKGVVFTEKDKILEYTQEKMVVGQTQNNMIYTVADIEPTITISSNVKRLNIINKTGAYKTIKLPIDNSGVVELIAVGTHLSGVDSLVLRVVGDDGSVTVIKSFSLSAAFDLRTYINLNDQTAATTKPVFFEIISPSSADTTFFTHLEVNRVIC